MRHPYLGRRGWALLGLVAVMAATGLGGCGSGEEKGGNVAYHEVLEGLKKAALAGGGYNAVNRAEDLEPTLKASIDAFCEVNREMLENEEAWKARKVGYYVVRVKLRAERELPYVSTGPVGRAVSAYKGLFGLASFDPHAVRRYSSACYS